MGSENYNCSNKGEKEGKFRNLGGWTENPTLSLHPQKETKGLSSRLQICISNANMKMSVVRKQSKKTILIRRNMGRGNNRLG